MMYKHFVYTSLIVIIAGIELTHGKNQQNENDDTSRNAKAIPDLKLGRIVSMWNKSSENSIPLNWESFQRKDNDIKENLGEGEFFETSSFTQNFPVELSKCLEDHRYQISENYSQGKNIILNCFKATVILNLMKYMGGSSKPSIKLFNGLVELKKFQEKNCENEGKCRGKYNEYFDQWGARRTLSQDKKNEYIKMYKRAMQKLVDRKNKFNTYRNLTEEEKADQLNRINEGSQAFLSEVIKNLGDEDAEKIEEEKIQREITDPRLISVLDAFSKNYMLKLRFYPGVAARMMRSHNGGVTFDLEINEAENDGKDNEEGEEEGEDEDIVSDEESTREIKHYKQSKDYFDSSGEGGDKKKRKKGKKKKKEMKKKAKKLKKIIPYLLLPMLIQLTLLPFVFKKLFFLAMKALFAGKVALILIGFNLLRNTCINNEDKYAQRIRVEHYGYNKGEEYGAWINGRSLQDSTLMEALSEEPYKGHRVESS